MTTFIFFTGINTGNQNLLTGELGYVGRDAVLDGRINASGTDIDVRIDGLASSPSVQHFSGNNNSLFIGRTGIVDGLNSAFASNSAIDFIAGDAAGSGIGRISNEGQIRGNVCGVFLSAGDSDDRVIVQNSGSVRGEEAGILLGGSGRAVISNSGLIEGFTQGITTSTLVFTFFQVALDLTNTGTIRGPDFSIRTADAADRVVNRGELWGDVSLGSGSDTLDNRTGTIEGDVALGVGDDRLDNRSGTIFGAVDGGDGKDTFFASATTSDQIDGGADFDNISYQSGPAVTLALDGSFANAGGALDDVITGIERVYGSNSGSDRIRGDDTVNHLFGMSGNDWLDGAGGADTIVGGIGTDTLTGGLGTDTFTFLTAAEAGDTITDFSAVSGNDDRIRLFAAGFAGGLVAGTSATSINFLSRADNLAQDSDDRFIFRTTDQTLWFDADGNGAGAAILLADLQAGAVVVAADILIA